MRFIRSSVRVVAFALIVCVAGLSAASVPSCTPTDVAAQKAAMDQTAAQIDTSRAKLMEQYKADADRGDAAAVARDQDALSKLDKARALLEQGRAALAASTNPDGTFNPQGAITAVGTGVMAANPALGLAIMIGGPLVASLGTWIAQQLRVNSANKNAKQTTEQAKAVVTSIETARQASPEFHQAFDKVARIIDTVQASVPGTKDLVDGHQKVELPQIPSALA